MPLLFEEVTDENFLIFGAKYYYNPTCIDPEEFHEDLQRFKYIKRLVNRYEKSGDMQCHLILNHLIVIFNVFGIDPGLKMLEHKIGLNKWSILKPFLIFLNMIEYNKYPEVKMDQNVVDALRKFKEEI